HASHNLYVQNIFTTDPQYRQDRMVHRRIWCRASSYSRAFRDLFLASLRGTHTFGGRPPRAVACSLTVVAGNPALCSTAESVSSPPVVDAPSARSGHGQVEKDKAVNYSRFPSIQQRPKPMRSVRREIGNRHLASENESNWPREGADQNQE